MPLYLEDAGVFSLMRIWKWIPRFLSKIGSSPVMYTEYMALLTMSARNLGRRFRLPWKTIIKSTKTNRGLFAAAIGDIFGCFLVIGEVDSVIMTAVIRT